MAVWELCYPMEVIHTLERGRACQALCFYGSTSSPLFGIVYSFCYKTPLKPPSWHFNGCQASYSLVRRGFCLWTGSPDRNFIVKAYGQQVILLNCIHYIRYIVYRIRLKGTGGTLVGANHQRALAMSQMKCFLLLSFIDHRAITYFRCDEHLRFFSRVQPSRSVCQTAADMNRVSQTD